jgi:two-component system, OmpR family, sensor histidine kinase SenX3
MSVARSDPTGPVSIRDVNPTALVLFAAAVGALLGAVVAVAILSRRPVVEAAVAAEPRISSVVEHLHAPAVLVGEHDEVLAASSVARATGFVVGTRLGLASVLEAARIARADNSHHELLVDQPSHRGAEPQTLSVHIVPLDGQLLVLADDHSAQQRFDATRRDFVANVTHELKTPIGAITLLADAIHGAADDERSVRKFSGKLSAEAARLDQLVSQIIALSQLQSEDPLSEGEVIDVEEVAEGAVERATAFAQARDVRLTLRTASGCQVFGDPRQLGGAIGNLIENAIAYSDVGARVAVVVRRIGGGPVGGVQIAVSDNGIGISADDLARVFERFYRVSYDRSRASGGTGLGLSIVKHVAEAHGGEVSAWSEPGEGSTFTITLPAVHETETP